MEDRLSPWQEIRSNWVNGNREDAADLFYQKSKLQIFKIVFEAVAAHYDSMDPCSHSGDILDLLEILKRLTKGL